MFSNYSRPERVWLVTSRLGTGKRLTFFYSVQFCMVRRKPLPDQQGSYSVEVSLPDDGSSLIISLADPRL
jgi:hypothetical protein